MFIDYGYFLSPLDEEFLFQVEVFLKKYFDDVFLEKPIVIPKSKKKNKSKLLKYYEIPCKRVVNGVEEWFNINCYNLFFKLKEYGEIYLDESSLDTIHNCFFDKYESEDFKDVVVLSIDSDAYKKNESVFLFVENLMSSMVSQLNGLPSDCSCCPERAESKSNFFF